MSAAPPPGNPPTSYSAGRIAVLIIGTVLLLPGGCVFVMFVFSVSDAARRGRLLDFSDPFVQLMLIVWAVCLGDFRDWGRADRRRHEANKERAQRNTFWRMTSHERT